MECDSAYVALTNVIQDFNKIKQSKKIICLRNKSLISSSNSNSKLQYSTKNGNFNVIKKIVKNASMMGVFNVVRKLREQRYSSVTDVEQYKFIYDFALYWIKKNYPIKK